MTKIVLNDVVSGANVSVVNDNFTKIETALNEKVLYRDNPTGEPNNMLDDLDMNSNRIYNLPKPVNNSEPARYGDLLDAAIAPGAFIQADHVVVTDAPNSYTSNNVEDVLQEIASRLLNSGDAFNVKAYGAVGDGVTDDTQAFKDCWAAIKNVGGEYVVPRGTYLLNETIIFDIVAPVNIRIKGIGAQIKATSAVTGHQFQVYGSYNEFLLDIEGFYFNHRGNANVNGCIQILGGHCVKVSRNTVEAHSTKAGYSFISIATKIPGSSEDDWNSFWCTVTGNSTRKRSGGEPGTMTYGIKLTGAVNAFTARDNTISNVDYGLYVSPAPTTKTLPNGTVLDGNWFETITTAAVHIQMTPGSLGPTGWRLMNNRVEGCPTFLSLATGGAAAAVHSQPPYLIGNYCTTGSVTNWILNPTNYPVSALESRYPGYGPSVNNELWQSGGFTLRFDSGYDFKLLDAAGSTDYNRGKIAFGPFYTWINPSNGKMYLKSGQPTSGTDGTVVGTQT